jgi:hypothetical protein
MRLASWWPWGGGCGGGLDDPKPASKDGGDQRTSEQGHGHQHCPLDIGFREGGNEMLNIKVVAWSLAIWTTFSYVFCVVYGLVTPSSMHMLTFLEQVLPGFEPNSWRGFLVGLVQSFLYGVYAGVVYVPVYNFLHRRWGRQ